MDDMGGDVEGDEGEAGSRIFWFSSSALTIRATKSPGLRHEGVELRGREEEASTEVSVSS